MRNFTSTFSFLFDNLVGVQKIIWMELQKSIPPSNTKRDRIVHRKSYVPTTSHQAIYVYTVLIIYLNRLNCESIKL